MASLRNWQRSSQMNLVSREGRCMTDSAVKLREILDLCVKLEASDVHITGDMPPYMRIQGSMTPAIEETLSPILVEQMALGLMTENQLETFAKYKHETYHTHTCKTIHKLETLKSSIEREKRANEQALLLQRT